MARKLNSSQKKSYTNRDRLYVKSKRLKLNAPILKKRIEILDALLDDSGTEAEESKLDIKKKVELFHLNDIGETSCLHLPIHERCPLVIQDTYSLIRQAVIKSTSLRPRWCNFSCKCPVVLVIVEGIAIGDLRDVDNLNENVKLSSESIKQEITTPQLLKYRNSSSVNQPSWFLNSLPKSSSCFPIRLEVKSNSFESENLLKDILHAEAGEAEHFLEELNEKTAQQYNGPSFWEDNIMNKEDAFDRTNLLLNLKTMLALGYPVPFEESNYSTYKQTKNEYTKVTAKSPMFGLDCEMCLTAQSNELSRISIVDENLKVIYTSYVKPHNKIINYITEFSGVLPQHLKNCKIALEDVQIVIQNFLPADAILVGHSLESDLRALKMMHPYVIDTALIFNLYGMRGQRASLKLLSQLFLKERIQVERSHHPTEDAKACLKLAMLKLKNDLSFGDAVLRGHIPYSSEELQMFTKVHMFEAQKKRESLMGESHERNLYFDKRIQSSSIFYMMSKGAQNDFNIITSREASHLCIPFVPLDHRNNIISEEKCPKKILKRIENANQKLQVAFIPECDSNGDVITRMKRIRKVDEALSKLHSRLKNANTVLFLTLFTGSSNYDEEKNSNGCLLIEVIRNYFGRKRHVVNGIEMD